MEKIHLIGIVESFHLPYIANWDLDFPIRKISVRLKTTEETLSCVLEGNAARMFLENDIQIGESIEIIDAFIKTKNIGKSIVKNVLVANIKTGKEIKTA